MRATWNRICALTFTLYTPIELSIFLSSPINGDDSFTLHHPLCMRSGGQGSPSLCVGESFIERRLHLNGLGQMHSTCTHACRFWKQLVTPSSCSSAYLSLDGSSARLSLDGTLLMYKAAPRSIAIVLPNNMRQACEYRGTPRCNLPD